MALSASDRSEIAFFDVETSIPTRQGQRRVLLEFGAILVCPRTLIELDSYRTFVKPSDLNQISNLARSNGITRDAVVSAPSFAEIADKVYDILHGRIWAGHKILTFDCLRVREAFAEINRPPPEPRGTIDSLALLTQRFGSRAGDMKMATLATYFGLGKQTHRSLDDVRMNLEVLKYCATVLFLESSLPSGPVDFFFEPHEISLPSISASLAPFYGGTQKIQILHKGAPLQVCGRQLKVRFRVSTKYHDRLSFVVDASPILCEVLDYIDRLAQKLLVELGSNSKWRPSVTRNPGFINYPTLRLQLPTISDGTTTTHRWSTEIYHSSMQRIVFSKFDVTELDSLLTPGRNLDACFSLDTYDFQQNAGIKLMANKLIILPN